MSIHPFPASDRQPPFAKGGGGGYHDPMEARMTALETRLDTILPTLATKSDIAELRGEFKGWTLTTALTLAGTMLAGFVGIATLLWNVAKPAPAASAAGVQPIIIYAPGTAPTPAPAASGK